MSLTQRDADKIVRTLKAEFNHKAQFEAKGQLSGGYKVFVHHARKADENTLKAIENRANVVAGRTLTRTELEFKTGQITF